jgi:exodeoxyribonuclease V beta subunit
LDRIKRKNTNRASLLFEYDNIKLKNIFHKNSQRENFDELYNVAINKEKQLIIDDELNILYVALTRAKNNMFIFKKMKNSVFELLGDSCSSQTIGQLYIKQKNNIDIKKEIPLNYMPLNLGQQTKQIQTEDIDEVNIHKRYFGIATHYCLEMMAQFNEASLEISLNMTKNKYSNILSDNDFQDINQRIIKLLDNKQFQDMLLGGEYSKEQALIFDKNIKILDLLIKKDKDYIICDYKTTTKQKDEHISQVGFYKKAIKNIVKSDNIKSYVIYLQKDLIDIIEV